MQPTTWLNTGVPQMMGWVIIHSIWQACLLFSILKLALSVINDKHANIRYWISISALFALVTCTAATAYIEYGRFVLSPGSGPDTAPTLTISPALPAATAQTVATPTVSDSPSYAYTGWLTAITPYLALAWIIGIALYTARLFQSAFLLNQLRKVPNVPHPAASSMLDNLCAAMGIRRKPTLLVTENIDQPLTFGFARPVILLPLSYSMQVPPDQLEMILAHELSHIRRNDYIVNMIQSGIEVLLFFNPFAHWISAAITNEREHCCDDTAAVTCGDSQLMAIALTNLKAYLSPKKLALAAAPSKDQFRERIYRLIAHPATTRWRMRNALHMLITPALVLVLLTQCVADPHQNNSASSIAAGDSVKQRYADNQAGRKIELFSYTKEHDGQPHEILLISTPEGNPLYAYLDGQKTTDPELAEITTLVRRSKNISDQQLATIPRSARAIRMDSSLRLNHEVDSINDRINVLKRRAGTSRSPQTQSMIDSCYRQMSIRTDGIKALAMEDYKEDVQHIPADTQLHQLLTSIVTGMQYTPEQRLQLNQLVDKKTAGR